MANTDISIFGRLPTDCVNIILTMLYQLQFNDCLIVIKDLNKYELLLDKSIQIGKYLKVFMYNNHITQRDYIDNSLFNRYINKLFAIHKSTVSREGEWYFSDYVEDDYDIVKHKMYKGNPIKCYKCDILIYYDGFDTGFNFEGVDNFTYPICEDCECIKYKYIKAIRNLVN